MQKTLKENIITILSAVAIVSMFLPFLSVSAETDYSSFSAKYSGLQCLQFTILGYLLLVGPALLIATNYVPQIKSLKKILSICVPFICLIGIYLVYVNTKSGALAAQQAANAATSAMGVESKVDVSIGFGMILCLLSHCAMAFLGFKTLKAEGSIKETVPNFDEMKDAGAKFINNVQEKARSAVDNFKDKNK